jgi:hypothetical protein
MYSDSNAGSVTLSDAPASRLELSSLFLPNSSFNTGSSLAVSDLTSSLVALHPTSSLRGSLEGLMGIMGSSLQEFGLSVQFMVRG